MKKLLILCLVITSLTIQAQKDTSFWFVAPYICTTHEGNLITFFCISAIDHDAQVHIEMPANASFVAIDTLVPVGTSVIINTNLFYTKPNNQPYTANDFLNFNVGDPTPFQKVLDYGIHITSDNDVSVYYNIAGGYNMELYLLKGRNALGTSFYCPFQNMWQNMAARPDAFSQLDIVATEDNTDVQIRVTAQTTSAANGSILVSNPGDIINVTLNKGQTFAVRAKSKTAVGHLSGTRVTSSKKIAITITDDSVQPAGTGCGDIIGDQLIPVNICGSKYIAMRSSLSTSPYIDGYVIITATQPNTDIMVDGSMVATLTSAGQTMAYQINISSSFALIEASHPVCVLNISGFGCEVGGAILPKAEQTGTMDVSFYRLNTVNFSLFLNLMVRDAGVNGFRVITSCGDTVPIPSSYFVPIPGSGWMTLGSAYKQFGCTSGSCAALTGLCAIDDVSPGTKNGIPAANNAVTRIINEDDIFQMGFYTGSPTMTGMYGYMSSYDKMDQRINFDPIPYKTFGDSIFSLVAISTQNVTVLFKSSDTNIVSIDSGKARIKNAGTVTITAYHPGNDTLNRKETSRSITIYKALLTVKADNKTRLTGESNPAFTLTYTGFKYGQNETSINTKPVGKTIATEFSPVGNYPITVSGGFSANYDFNYVNGILNVQKITCTHQAIINNTAIPKTCPGDTVILEANNDGGFIYQWYKDGIQVQNSFSSKYECTMPGSYTVLVTGENCSAISGSVTVDYFQKTEMPLIVIRSGKIESCKGGSIVLGTTMDYAAYKWNTGSDSASTIITKSGKYKLTVTDTNGCKTAANPFEINAASVPMPTICAVTVDPLTSKNIVVWNREEGLPIKKYYVYKQTAKADEFKVIDSADYGADNYVIDDSSDANVKSDYYYVTASDSCGTESVQSTIHKTLHVNVDKGLYGSVNITMEKYEGVDYPSYYIYHSTDKTDMKIMAEIASNIWSYSVYDNIKPYYQISIQLPQTCVITSLLKAEIGPYTQSLSNITEYKTAALTSTSVQGVTVSPNPFSELITISFMLDECSDVGVEVYNTSGQKLYEKSLKNLNAGNQKINLHPAESRLTVAGIYVIKLISGNEVAIQKVWYNP